MKKYSIMTFTNVPHFFASYLYDSFDTYQEAEQFASSIDLDDVVNFYKAKDATEIYIEIEEESGDNLNTLKVLEFYKFAGCEWLSYEDLAKKMKIVENLKELLKSSDEEEAPYLLEILDSMDFDPVRLDSDYCGAFEDPKITALLFDLAYCC